MDRVRSVERASSQSIRAWPTIAESLIRMAGGRHEVACPHRRRLQQFIDLRFYRSRYDAARALTSFGSTLQEEVDLEDVSLELLNLVLESVRPSHVSLWIRAEKPAGS